MSRLLLRCRCAQLKQLVYVCAACSLASTLIVVLQLHHRRLPPTKTYSWDAGWIHAVCEAAEATPMAGNDSASSVPRNASPSLFFSSCDSEDLLDEVLLSPYCWEVNLSCVENLSSLDAEDTVGGQSSSAATLTTSGSSEASSSNTSSAESKTSSPRDDQEEEALSLSAWHRLWPAPDEGEDSKSTSCGRLRLVRNEKPVPKVDFRAPCLQRYVQQECPSDGLPVPRLVHYVWFGLPHPLDLVTFLSVLSAYRFLRPCLVLFHSDHAPSGPYWAALRALVPVLVRVRREAPATVFGRTLGAVQHKSDIARLEALREYGGIYLDGDQLVLRSLDEFRGHQFVMGHENANNLANSLLISVPQASFIDLWYLNYKTYNPKQWGIHSTFLPLALARLHPTKIHIAGYAFVRPDIPTVRQVWQGPYDWGSNHAIHLYQRSMVQEGKVRTNYSLSELLRLRTALGEIARHVVYGSKESCLDPPATSTTVLPTAGGPTVGG